MLALSAATQAAAIDLGITSNGELGNIEFFNSGFINTDNSALYYNSNGNAVFDHFLASHLVTQADGSSLRVFNFANLTVDEGYGLVLFGSTAGVLAASGNIVINGSVVVTANGRPGGAPNTSAPGPTGGQAGSGVGQHIDPPCCGYDTPSGGGGGGKASQGADGNAGQLFPSLAPNGAGGAGGAADTHLESILSGGGGGGGGLYGFGAEGRMGGAGGGAVLFVAAGDFYMGAHGAIHANGFAGDDTNNGGAGGGGGAGGAIWFDVAGVWTNYGAITALGGRGGNGGVFNGPVLTTVGNGGVGAGGQVFIDPLEIHNFGLIDVSDGAGSDANGGAVDLIAPLVTNNGTIRGVAPVTAGVPEPGTWSLAMLGFGLLGSALRRRRACAPA